MRRLFIRISDKENLMNKKLIIFLGIVTLSHSLLCQASIKERRLIILIPSYNNINYYKRNLDSVVSQKYNNWHAYYIDDCSTDGTREAVERYIEEQDAGDKITLVRNQNRMLALAN